MTIDLEKLVALVQAERDRDELQALPKDFDEEIKLRFIDLNILVKAASNYREADLLRDELRSSIDSYLALMNIRKRKIIDTATTWPAIPKNALSYELILHNLISYGLVQYHNSVMTPVDAAYRRESS